ncbi:MAG: NADH-quinone oxidoreductase subunit I [Bdellovibrionales bacterium]|nr:NADH-quinone oxidoreductase subunit I [Bdellovibrionales bacterium]
MSIVQKSAQKGKWYLPGILGGMGITMRHMIKNLISRKSMPTINYPEEKYEYSSRFKGNHVLTVKKDGNIRCTACMLCATNCPAECIKIVASENEYPKVEKFPISYEIDILRCVFCGFCEEACPVDAIRLGPEWQTPGISGSNFIYDINHLAYRPSLKGGIQSHVDDEERHKEGI